MQETLIKNNVVYKKRNFEIFIVFSIMYNYIFSWK